MKQVFVVLALGLASMVGCTASSTSEGAPRVQLKWSWVDEAEGIKTACAKDSIRLYVSTRNAGGLSAVRDDSC